MKNKKDEKIIETKHKKDNIFDYVKKSKIAIMIIIFFLLLTYIGRLTNSSFSIDTELYINNHNNSYTWWISLNRWALVIINKLTGMSNLLIPQANYLTVILILIYSILLNYLFYLNMDSKWERIYYKLQFIFPALMLTSPIFAEAYNFTLQNVGVAFGICLITIVLILYEKIDSKELIKFKKITSYILGILIATFAFGVYQAIIPLYILIVSANYLLKCIKFKDSQIKWLIKQILLFGISALFYLIISKLLGTSNSYLNFGWTTNGLTSFKYILDVIKETIKCETIFYNISYLIAIIFIIIINVYLIIKKKTNIGIIIGSIAVIASPFFINFITGVSQLKRTQFNYPICIAFIFLIFILFVKYKNYKYLYYFLLVLALGISYKQAMISANLFYSDEIRYQNDILLAEKIEKMIEEKDWYQADEDYTLILVGKIENNAINSYQKGEIMGYSFFEFDSLAYYGVSSRAVAFMKTLGYYYNTTNYDDFEEAKNYIKENDILSYPNKECITKIDNKIIVRLSEEFE